MTAYLRGSRLENPSLLPEEGQAEGEERLSQLENPAEQALAKGRGRPAPRDVSWGAPGLPSRQAAELPRPGLTPSRWQPSVTLQGRSRRPVVKLFCTTAPGHCRSLSHTRTSTRAHTHTLPFHAKEGHRTARFVTHRQEPAGRRRWAGRAGPSPEQRVAGHLHHVLLRPAQQTTSRPRASPRVPVRPQHLGQRCRRASCSSRLSRRLLAEEGAHGAWGQLQLTCKRQKQTNKSKAPPPLAHPG